MDTLTTATEAALLILVASMVSVELALSAAILEIVLGFFAGNALGVTTTPWIDFLASFASVLLTFLAGAEVDPAVLRNKSREALAIAGLSFVVPLSRLVYSPFLSDTGASDRRRSPVWRCPQPPLPSFMRSWSRQASIRPTLAR